MHFSVFFVYYSGSRSSHPTKKYHHSPFFPKIELQWIFFHPFPNG